VQAASSWICIRQLSPACLSLQHLKRPSFHPKHPRRSQSTASLQQLEGLASPRPSYPMTSAAQRAAKIWQSGPLQEALNEFIGEQPQSMHSGLLPQDNPAGARARARGLAYPSGSVNVSRAPGGGRRQKSADVQSEVRGGWKISCVWCSKGACDRDRVNCAALLL
jgi:hypothetical protein